MCLARVLPASLCGLRLPSWAQQPSAQGQPPSQQPNPAPPKISVSVKVVNVLASVRNKHGEIVRNLTKDDFELEDGRPETIGYFCVNPYLEDLKSRFRV